MFEYLKDLLINIYPGLIFYFGVSLFIYFFRDKIVGKAGEHYVKVELNKLPRNEYMVINDVMLKTSYSTHQIDHLVISKYGIFVIETKQYGGYIVGNEYDRKWKQNKHYINNPIHQNYGHVKALEEIIDISEDIFIPIVCIPSRARFKINSKSHVVHIYELPDTINLYKEEKLSNYIDIYNKINQMNVVDKKQRKEHVKYAKEVKKTKDFNSENSCPKCGGVLLRRNGKYGEFIGCSNFPKCRFVKR